ncbi:MAG: serine/threonine protein kinase [Planctomycetales bacterium]
MSAHPRYELLEKIASGSYATVYRGRDIELGREIAIKQIHDQFLQDPQQLDRYWQEAQLLASFQHPNIVTIFDVVRDRGWLILELMQSDLSRVAGRKQMDLGALRTTLAHCLRALKFLHAHGIVHGDIKPSNMMIDRRRRVKIGDFGLARRVSDEEGSLIKGTTKYMAPEVVSDEFGEVGPASDLYSLGFAAYELMCGENFESLFPGLSAFGRDRQMAWMMWHAAPDRRLPEIQRVLADVPPDLARTIQKLVAKPQQERYQSAEQALSDLNIDVKLVKSSDDVLDSLGKTTVGKPLTAAPDRKRWIAIGAFALSLVLSLAALFLPGDSGGKSDETVPTEKPITGIVREVLPDEGRLVIVNEQGIPEEITVGKGVHIQLDDGDHILLRNLQVQDRVEISQPPGRPMRIEALRPVKGDGTLKAIDPEGAQLTLSIAADPHPQDVPMYVPKRAQLQLNGKPVALSDLQPGDRASVFHLKDTQGRAARDVITLEALRDVTLVGFVAQVAALEGKSSMTVERLGTTVPMQFAEGCKIAINGESGIDGRPFTPADLLPGDRVVVTHDLVAKRVEAERRARQTGVMLKIEPANREIQVQSDDGTRINYQLTDETQIRLNDQPATMEDLRPYDKMDVTSDPTDQPPARARTIDARRASRE